MPHSNWALAASPRLAGCTGALIAGGEGARLGGIAKGLLRLDGEPILARALRTFARLFEQTLVVANDPGPYAPLGVTGVPDRIPGKGAPGGLHAALSASKSEWVFAAACDMPFLAEEPIVRLWAEREGVDAVLVRWNGRVQPLHAFWSRGCLPALERLLREGDPSFFTLASAVRARIVPEETWRRFDPEGRAFENANTPADAVRLGLEPP